MKRLVVYACAALMSVCAGLSPLHAQETVAAQPTAGVTGQTNEAYERKIQDLTRILRIMEEQISKCAAQQGITCPSVLAAQERSVVRHTMAQEHGDAAREEDEGNAASPTNMAPPAPAYTPPVTTRYGTGFRVAPEQRLTCDDYSTSYFQRHPTMAKVCGRLDTQPEAEPALPTRPVVPSSVTVSTTQGL